MEPSHLGLTKVSLTLDQIRSIKSAIAFGAPFSDRISIGLAMRLMMLEKEHSESGYVLAEMRSLEDGLLSATKPAEQFKHSPLHPIWHKHFVTPRHLFRNVGLHWGIEVGKCKLHLAGEKRLDGLISEVASDFGSEPDKWQQVLSHRFVMDGLEGRAGKQTGDWLLFAKHGGKNYYLEIAGHDEAIGSNAHQLLRKIQDSAQAEFPFCF